MSQVATLAVVEGKMLPIAAALEVRPEQFTAQAAINLFSDYSAAIRSESHSVCSVLINTAIQSRNATVEEFGLATRGMVEATRVKVGDKYEDGTETALARKFQSMVRAIFGAVKAQLIALEEVQAFTNSQGLYDTSRKCLADAKLDWKGLTDAEKEQAASKRNLKSAIKSVMEEEDTPEVLELSPEQFTELRSKAAKKLAEKAAKDKLNSMEKRAEKLAKDLVASYGLDDAEEVLKRAIENLTKLAMGA